ncbi:MAG: winged helix-turn-helix transcriptional regulator, partial [Acidobacteriaceae bacterium]|nr:winged helix-turn-helix transcriptional regulator [Acidobacteriaceae bacterium]MBV9295944.1 winged helix-turn-helix transcriptional regulator [Acidobacteriaceae bacterium]
AWDEVLEPLSNIVDVYMNRLRKKLDGGFQQRLIHTRRSEGYMISVDDQTSKNKAPLCEASSRVSSALPLPARWAEAGRSLL